jgi:beta-barrel assembly-enhancing protease
MVRTGRKRIFTNIFFVFAGLLVLFLMNNCAVNPVTGRSQLMLVSEDQEIAMGKQVYPNALWGGEGGGGEYKDPNLKAYLKNIIVNIHRVSHRPNLPVDFDIQNSSVPNAWAIPGHVAITRGLLAAIDNEAEFAFIMGHEMGHVSARHSASQMSHATLGQVLFGGTGFVLGGSVLSDVVLTAGAVGTSLVLLKFSRADELDADKLGVLYMTRLGYDPKNALSAHRNLEKVSQQYGQSIGQDRSEQGFFNELISTHPRTSIRIDEVQNIINETPRDSVKGDGTERQHFQSMVANLRRVNTIYLDYYDKAARALNKNELQEASSLITQAISMDQTQPAFYTLNGFIALKRKNDNEARRQFLQALNLDGNYQPALRGLGAIHYMDGNYNEGINYLKRSLALFPEDAPSHYFLGMTYYRTRSYRSAIEHLNNFAEAQPKHPGVHGVLGQCYENVNDPQSAYNEYMLQIQIDANSDIGKLSTSRAKAIKSSIRQK